jgi:hypothetical protein
MDSPVGLPPRKLQTASAGDWGSLTSKVDLTLTDQAAAVDGPLRQSAWKLDDSWRCPVAGPFALYGQLGGNSEEQALSDLKLNGKTGLACKMELFAGSALELRSGPSLSCSDPLRPDRVNGKSEWLVEVQARLPLVAGLGLEYQSSLSPALTPQDKNTLNTDIHLAAPLGDGGKIQLGAKRRWEAATDARPTDTMEVYLGLEWAR